MSGCGANQGQGRRQMSHNGYEIGYLYCQNIRMKREEDKD